MGRKGSRALLLGGLAFSGCSCDDGASLFTARVELEVVAVLPTPCRDEATRVTVSDDTETTPTRPIGLRSSQAQVFELRSLGEVPVTLQQIRLVPENEALTIDIRNRDGNVVETPLRIPSEGANAEAPVVVQITTAPISEPVNVELVVESDDPNRRAVRVPLVAGPGQLEVTPPRIDFGSLRIGEEAMETVRIDNRGAGTVAIREIELVSTSAEFCAPEATLIPGGAECGSAPQCPVLGPNESMVVNVRYAPRDGGNDTGLLEIVSEDAGTVEVSLSGQGAGPALCLCVVEGSDCLRAAGVDFGTVPSGDAAIKTVRLESCGTDAIELAAVDLEPRPSEFEILTPFATGPLEPGESSEGRLSYRASSNTAAVGQLVVRQSQPDLESRFALAANTVGCNLAVLPRDVAFGAVPSDSTGRRSVLLSNTGARPCEVTAITDPDNGFTLIDKPPLPLAVPAGASQVMTVEFEAPAESMGELHESTFEVVSSADTEVVRQTVSLTALAGGLPRCEVAVRPSASTPFGDGLLSYGILPAGGTRTRSVTIRNWGSVDCVLESYVVEFDLPIGGPSRFQALDQPLPVVIAPASEARIDVLYTSDGSGLNLNTSAVFNHLDFTLSGTGLAKTEWKIALEAEVPVEPAMVVTPTELDFGVVTWDQPQAPDNRSACGSRTRNLAIHSTGTEDLLISRLATSVNSDLLFQITDVRQSNVQLLPPYENLIVTPGETVDVSMRFFPTRATPNLHSGALQIESNVAMGIDRVDLTGEGRDTATQTDVFTQNSGNMVDILWVIDDSGSMDDEQARVAQNFATFIDLADSLSIDYHVAVTTTEVNNLDAAGKIWACAGYNEVIASNDPQRVAAFNCAAAVSNPPNGNLPPNEGNSGEQEAGLRAAELALTTPNIDGPNSGFLRFDASLAVIVVSDEEDQSDGPVSDYVSFFQGLKGDPDLVSFSAIAGDVPGGCDGADEASRYHAAATALGGGFESICAPTWNGMLEAIGFGAFTRRTSWPLSRQADPSTIVVSVNGGLVREDPANGWTYDPATNTVNFHGTAVPPDAATIQFTYDAICL